MNASPLAHMRRMSVAKSTRLQLCSNNHQQSTGQPIHCDQLLYDCRRCDALLKIRKPTSQSPSVRCDDDEEALVNVGLRTIFFLLRFRDDAAVCCHARMGDLEKLSEQSKHLQTYSKHCGRR